MVVRPTTDPDRLLAYWEVVLCWVEDGGGWVTSPAYAWPVRFEAKPDSELPKRFRQSGYSVINSGTAERFLPFTETVRENGTNNLVKRQHLKSVSIEIWDVRMPEAGR